MASTAEPAIAVLILIFFVIYILYILILGVAMLSVAFWIWMIVDVAKRDFRKDADKIVWILVVVLAGVIGAVIYYFVVKRPNKK